MTAPTQIPTQQLAATQSWSADEYAVWSALRPILAECLSLNHALNNSLAGILGYTEFLLSEPQKLSADQRHYLEQITMCAELIRTRIEAVSLEKTALRERIDIQAITEALAPGKGITGTR